MPDLTTEQLAQAIKLFTYRKNYYAQYQKERKEKVRQRQNDYLERVYADPDKYEKMKARQKEYYKNVIKPKRELARQNQALMINE